MLIDYEQELTTKDGQAVVANSYGTKSYDQKGVADPAIGEPLYAFAKVEQDFSKLTSLAVAIVGDDDGAGTNEVSVLSKSFLLAELTAAGGTKCLGIVPPGVAKRYLRAKFTVTGTEPDAGKIKVWLGKGTDLSPANAAGTV